MSSNTAVRKKSGASGAWIWLALLVVGGSAFGAWKAGWIGATEEKQLLGATVEKKTLVISVVQRGNLASKDALSVKSEIEGQATILSLIPEGTMVEPGVLLCELDVAELRDKKVTQDIAVQNADASWVKAKAQYEIQVSQNESDIEAAARKLLFAQKDRDKYLGRASTTYVVPAPDSAAPGSEPSTSIDAREAIGGTEHASDEVSPAAAPTTGGEAPRQTTSGGDFAQQRDTALEKITLAEAEQAKAKNTLKWSKELADKGFLTQTELERDELEYQRTEVAVVQAKRALDLLLQFDDPRMIIELDANVLEAERGLERAKLQATSRLADFNSALVTSESKLKLEQEKLQKLVEQIAKGQIKSTQSGMVVYARVEGGGRGGNSDPIQVGTQVRERQEILSIPRTTGIIVEASVHESVLRQVAVGKPCKIVVDALRDQQFDGRVTFVALLPDKGSWWANPNQRLYRTEIQVLNPDREMRPGMSCGIEILSEIVPDALVTPLQSIFLDEGKTIAFVVHGEKWERREVKTGRSSQTLVEVLDGLKPGEVVLLAPPAGFTPKAAERGEELDSFQSVPAGDPAAGAPADGRGAPNANGAAEMRGPRNGGGEAPNGANGGGQRRPRGDGAGGGREGRGGGSRPREGAAASGDAQPEKKDAPATTTESGGGAR